MRGMGETFQRYILCAGQGGGLGRGAWGGAVDAPRIREALFDYEWYFEENEIGKLIEWVIQDLMVAPEALRILVNLAESAMYDFENVIFSLSLSYGPTPLAIESLGLPAEWPECPFEVEEYPLESRDFDIEVVLAKALTGERIRPLTDPHCRVVQYRPARLLWRPPLRAMEAGPGNQRETDFGGWKLSDLSCSEVLRPARCLVIADQCLDRYQSGWGED